MARTGATCACRRPLSSPISSARGGIGPPELSCSSQLAAADSADPVAPRGSGGPTTDNGDPPPSSTSRLSIENPIVEVSEPEGLAGADMARARSVAGMAVGGYLGSKESGRHGLGVKKAVPSFLRPFFSDHAPKSFPP